ncbi:hypothetical protein CDD83_8625 [Cordyceps sp. RAO-2017]|nr:hypothetical protein CDD83_8625 [Cordyceps sp. RAO-2017]
MPAASSPAPLFRRGLVEHSVCGSDVRGGRWSVWRRQPRGEIAGQTGETAALTDDDACTLCASAFVAMTPAVTASRSAKILCSPPPPPASLLLLALPSSAELQRPCADMHPESTPSSVQRQLTPTPVYLHDAKTWYGGPGPMIRLESLANK